MMIDKKSTSALFKNCLRNIAFNNLATPDSSALFVCRITDHGPYSWFSDEFAMCNNKHLPLAIREFFNLVDK